MGAGWYVREHTEYGFPYPEDGVRLGMLAEQLEVVHRQWREEVVDFEGAHYRLEGLRAHPRPVQHPHPPIILGGSAGPRSAALAARFSDEYNTVTATPEECRERRGRLAEAWEREGRDPSTLRFSLMTPAVVGADRDDVRRRLRAQGEDDPDAYVRDRPAALFGTVDEVVARLGELEAAGVDRVMLQHLAHDDLEMVELVGSEIVRRVNGSAG